MNVVFLMQLKSLEQNVNGISLELFNLAMIVKINLGIQNAPNLPSPNCIFVCWGKTVYSQNKINLFCPNTVVTSTQRYNDVILNVLTSIQRLYNVVPEIVC